jgi:hypothetical protein
MVKEIYTEARTQAAGRRKMGNRGDSRMGMTDVEHLCNFEFAIWKNKQAANTTMNFGYKLRYNVGAVRYQSPRTQI